MFISFLEETACIADKLSNNFIYASFIVSDRGFRMSEFMYIIRGGVMCVFMV